MYVIRFNEILKLMKEKSLSVDNNKSHRGPRTHAISSISTPDVSTSIDFVKSVNNMQSISDKVF